MFFHCFKSDKLDLCEMWSHVRVTVSEQRYLPLQGKKKKGHGIWKASHHQNRNVYAVPIELS